MVNDDQSKGSDLLRITFSAWTGLAFAERQPFDAV
jgi:hypothetical protein